MDSIWLLSALFLPLFPFSALFVVIIRKTASAWLRGLLFLVWPQAGAWMLVSAPAPPPEWLTGWALATAILYAIRALVLRDVALWLGYVGVSYWSLLWIVLAGGQVNDMALNAFGLSLPLALLALLGGELEKRFAAAYSGLIGGIVTTHPRLSGVLAFATLAVIATPVFPGFFTLLTTVVTQMSVAPPVAIGMVLVWMLWSWSGIRLLQGLITGPTRAKAAAVADLSITTTGLYSILLLGMAGFGLYLAGGL